jgi:hypothetical protein
MLCAMDVDELRDALGGIVLEAAYLERILRAAFSALIGSKYVAAIDGRMMAHALIEDCHRLAVARADIPDPAKSALTMALEACDEVNKRRNRVIHDAWMFRPGQSEAGSRPATGNEAYAAGTRRSPADLTDLASQIGATASDLATAVTNALGPESLKLDDELRAEFRQRLGNGDLGP